LQGQEPKLNYSEQYSQYSNSVYTEKMTANQLQPQNYYCNDPEQNYQQNPYYNPRNTQQNFVNGYNTANDNYTNENYNYCNNMNNYQDNGSNDYNEQRAYYEQAQYQQAQYDYEIMQNRLVSQNPSNFIETMPKNQKPHNLHSGCNNSQHTQNANSKKHFAVPKISHYHNTGEPVFVEEEQNMTHLRQQQPGTYTEYEMPSQMDNYYGYYNCNSAQQQGAMRNFDQNSSEIPKNTSQKPCNPRHSVPLEQMYEQFTYFDQKDIDNNNDMPYGSSNNTENSENFDFNTKYNFSQNTKKNNTQNIADNNDMGNM